MIRGVLLLWIFLFAGVTYAQPIEDNALYTQENHELVTYDHFTNNIDGYSISYPLGMQVDTSLDSVKSVLFNDHTKIEVYYDDFTHTQHYYKGYVNYSNAFMKNTKTHIKEHEEDTVINGYKVHILKWYRPKLARLEKDQNYYVSAEIAKNNHEVYTILIKSSQPFGSYESYMNVIKSFQIIPKSNQNHQSPYFMPVKKQLNDETQKFYQKYFYEKHPLRWGIFEPTAPHDFNYLTQLEKRFDYEFEFIVKYQTLDSSFPMDELINAYDHKKYVELTLQTMHMNGEDNSNITYDLLDGKYDDYLHDYAKNLKAFNHPVLFRLNNEMNGDWCVYSSYHSSKDTELFKAVWKYIYNIFEGEGVDNVLWIFNPHDGSFPNFKWNHALNYYPGNEYVDIVGLTGYNTGTYYKGEKWRGFNQIYIPLYNEYMSTFAHPLMITEFGSNDVGGDKIGWINEMFSSLELNDFSALKVAIWWNGIDWDANKNPARVYRLDSNELLMDNFKNGFERFKDKEVREDDEDKED